jgi:hypothetical protein
MKPGKQLNPIKMAEVNMGKAVSKSQATKMATEAFA